MVAMSEYACVLSKRRISSVHHVLFTVIYSYRATFKTESATAAAVLAAALPHVYLSQVFPLDTTEFLTER